MNDFDVVELPGVITAECVPALDTDGKPAIGLYITATCSEPMCRRDKHRWGFALVAGMAPKLIDILKSSLEAATDDALELIDTGDLP